jgi:drug/metabolite transporter (DMT)-like permease
VKRLLKPGPVLAVGVLAMSTASIFIRYAQAEGAPPLVIAAYRLAVATLILSIPVARQQAWRDYDKLGMSGLGILVLSGTLLGLHFATWITSLAYTSIMSSVVLVSTTPLWIGLAAPLILKERTPGLTWIGIIVAVAGGIVIGFAGWSRTEHLTTWGDLLALTGAVLGAGYLMIGRSVRSRVSLTAYLWAVYGTAAVLLIAWSLIKGFALTGYMLSTVVWMVALGLIPQLIGHSAANYAVRHLPATLVGIAVLGEPIGSTLLGIILLDERPDPLQVTGGALILMGIALAARAGNDNNTQG